MFIKGSRYRNLPESSPVDASGERLQGKDVREIPPPLAGTFQHTVHQGDRLDLLSFKYYTDPTKWWQIADANPQEQFPPDLLDRGPLTKERFVLSSPGFGTRLRQLEEVELSGIAQVTRLEATSFDDEKPVEPSFVETTLIMKYAPATATHQTIVNKIESVNVGFHFLRAFTYQETPDTVEAFTFDDPATRNAWRNMVAKLMEIGVLDLTSMVVEGTLDLTYNNAIIPRESIRTVIESNGFTVEPATTTFPAVGSKILIPPYQTV